MRNAGIILVVVCVCLALLGVLPQARAQSGSVVGVGESGYTCCNFHYKGDWISDANWSYLPKIPAGSPVRILDYGDNRVSVEISGRRMILGLDYGRKMHLRDWTHRMVVADDPKVRIEAWPEAVREAILESKVVLGMSKEQVIVSIGYPPAHATPSLESPQWRYWRDTHGTYVVVWNDAGYVKEVLAPPPIRKAVLREGDVHAPSTVSESPVRLKDLEGLLQRPGGR